MSGTGHTTTFVSSSGDQIIDGLLTSVAWNDATVLYSLPTSNAEYSGTYGAGEHNGFFAATAAMEAVVHFALDTFYGTAGDDGFSVEGFTNLDIAHTTDTGAHLRISQTTLDPYDYDTAWGYYPSTGEAGGDVWLTNEVYDYSNPEVGTYAYLTLIHELGHALGLKHGHETSTYGALPAAYDGMEYSVMTYRSYVGGPTSGYTNETYGYAQSWMMADIAALQHMHGADFTTNSGNTVYSWTPGSGDTMVNGSIGINAVANRIFATVWDGGGIDTYDLSAYTTGVQIDLRPGEASLFSTAQQANLGGSNFARGNIYNALQYQGDARSLIENAIGGSGDDTIMGNAAANTLDGGGGNDSLDGQSGDDSLLGASGFDTLEGGAGDDTLYGGGLADLLRGGADNDSLFGEHGADILFGDGGSDTLEGGLGNDTLYGGDQADLLRGRTENDVLFGEQGDDTLYGDTGFDTLYGGNGNDTLYGGNQADVLRGGADNDRLEGGNGIDLLYGDSGFDTLYGGNGNDTLFGGTQADLLRGGADNDLLFGGGGIDWLYGDGGFDTLYGNIGNDTLFGGGLADLLYGGDDNDLLYGEHGADALFGQAGFDTLYGGDGNDTLYGGGQADLLRGGAGNDSLFGGTGRDFMYGDGGDDRMLGEGSADVFVFIGAFGNDTITDFDEFNDLEDIDLSAVAGITDYVDLVNNHMSQVGANVVIDDGAGNTITVLNALVANMNEADFTF